MTTLPAGHDGKPSIGLAGAFSGMDHDVLLIAGGANFPDKMPWDGGKKAYHDDVYVLKKERKGQVSWITTGMFKLKDPLAYGASLSTRYGLVCLGGEGQGVISSSTFILKWDLAKQQVIQQALPDLPVPLTNAAAASLGSKIFVAGGESTNAVSDKFFALDLGSSVPQWESLPTLPHALSHAVLVSVDWDHKKILYLIGGRKKTLSGISELYDQVYAYDPGQKQWTQRSSLPYALSAGTGLAAGKHSILLFGGDKGQVFHQTEELIVAIAQEKDEVRKRSLTEQKAVLQASHPGFSRDILQYDVINDRWAVNSQATVAIPVTTHAIRDGKHIIIPSGEIRAGVRSPGIIKAELKTKGHE